MDIGGLPWRRAEQGGAYHSFRCVHVVFKQPRRQVQRIADIVETERRRVSRESVSGTDIDAKQIADRVVVLGAIHPASGNASSVGLSESILPAKFGLEPSGDGDD